jgi:hypothetical protein
MSKLMITIHNAETGEIIEREMTTDELAQRDKDTMEQAARQEAEAVKANAKAALLSKLGITQDEAKLLLS